MPTFEILSPLFGPGTVNFVAQDPDRYNKGMRSYTVNFHSKVIEGQPCKINGVSYNFRNLTLKETHHPDRVSIYRDYYSLKRCETYDDPTSKALDNVTEHCKGLWAFLQEKNPGVYRESHREYLQGQINRLIDDVESKRAEIKALILKREKLQRDLDKLR